MKASRRIVAGQPSWILSTRDVELAVTELGGHMAPVVFHRNTARPLRPYYVSPWQGKDLPIATPVLRPLRGDFFCMPFGANADEWRGERHTVHGETASSTWRLEGCGRAGGVSTLALTMVTKVRRGKVTKLLSLAEGHNAVYSSHVLEGFSGPMPLGHHACLSLDNGPGAVRVATSPIRFGMTCPALFSDPAAGEYQSLAIGRRFSSLRKVPLIWKDPAFADCTVFPAREGFTDLLAVFNKPGHGPAWTAAANEKGGYLWFSFKNQAVLPITTFWIANHGRHSAPWDGKERCLGLEDVCAFFADGLAASARTNILTRKGIPTVVRLSPSRPTRVNYIQGATRIPRGFSEVATVRLAKSHATFVSTTGKTAEVCINLDFLRTGAL